MPKYLNRFVEPDYIERKIASSDGSLRGTLRIKPSSVLWKPAGAHKFHAVPLDTFERWITTAADARYARK